MKYQEYFPFTKNHIFIARSEDIKRMLTVCLSNCPRSFEESDHDALVIVLKFNRGSQ